MQTARILIVDDEPTNVSLLTAVLKPNDYEVEVAYNGVEAWRLVEQGPFDLALVDIMMPEMDGMELLRRIRQRYNMQQFPVILLSALVENDDIIAGLEQGANDYITKPLSLKVVRRRIQTQLELKLLADERQEALDATRRADEVKNQLLHIASHDLRNPLSNLSMILDLLPSTPPDEQTHLLNIGTRTLNEMSGIIEEFLEMGVMREDGLNVDLKPVMVDDYVLDVCKSYYQRATVKDIAFDLNLAPAHVLADERRLQQVLSNLLSNAVKYTQPGTTITIIGQPGPASYTLTIYDEGQGIPADERERLFQPFSKLSPRPTSGEPSTGLGLWIVKQMMDVQNGAVGLDVNYKDGAAFWIRLPLTKKEPEAALHTASA